MHGNAEEWGEDGFDGSQDSRVLRGGSFNIYKQVFLRSASRDASSPDNRDDYYVIGFRFSRTQ